MISFFKKIKYFTIFLTGFMDNEPILISYIMFDKTLNLYKAFIFCFLGTFISKQVLFLAAKKFSYVIEKQAWIVKKINKISFLMNKYEKSFMIVYRLIYGVRIISPLIIGLNNKTSLKKFTIFNLIGSLLWTSICFFIGSIYIYFKNA